MSDTDKHEGEQADDEKSFTIRWKLHEWERIQEAVRTLTEREHFRHSPTDVIRSGAMRRVEEILNDAA